MSHKISNCGEATCIRVPQWRCYGDRDAIGGPDSREIRHCGTGSHPGKFAPRRSSSPGCGVRVLLTPGLQLQLQMYNLLRREASRRCEVATQLVKTLKILLTRQVHNKNKGSRQTQGPDITTGHGCASMYMVRDRRGTCIV